MRAKALPQEGKGVQKVKDFLLLSRPLNAAMTFIAVVAGAYIACSLTSSSILAAIAAALVSAGAQSINDYFDFELDQRKGKHHALSKRGILYASIAYFSAGLLLALVAGLRYFLIALPAAVLSVFYSWRFSNAKYIGNAVVAFETALPFIYGGIYGQWTRDLFPFLLAFLATWSREIAKDMEDLVADRGVKRTLPMLSGKEMAAYFSAYLAFLAVFFSVFPGPLGLKIFDWRYYYLLVPTDLLFLIAGYYIIRGSPGVGQRLEKAAMVLALLAFLAGTVGSC